MAIQSWQNIIDMVRNGEPVSAEVANRAISQLVQRTEHLKNRQDAQSLAQAIFITGAPLDVGVKTGHAVYFDSNVNKFAAAYADIEFVNGLLQPTESTGVVGVVIYKDTADSGVIVVEGWINPDQYNDLDCQYVPMLNNMLLEGNQRGILYLASGSSNAGRLTNKPGILNIPVCNLISSTTMLVRPPITSSLDTQALKFKIKNGIASSDFILDKKEQGNSAVFNSFPPIGSEVKIYLSNGGNAASDEIDVYLTGVVESYANYSDGKPARVRIHNAALTKSFVKAVDANLGVYSEVFKPTGGNSIRMKVVGSNLTYELSTGPNAASCYVSPVSYNNSSGWEINPLLTDSSKPGWLPVSDSAFATAIIPAGAKYGYNVNKDSVLQQLFPEDIVTAYVVTKDGIGLSNQIVEINQSGIWWKDSLAQLPWHTFGSAGINMKNLLPDVQVKLQDWTAQETDSLIMPSELHVVYAKLITGGARVVTSLEAAPNSTITITDPYGNPASSGPLVLNAGFSLNEISSTESGFTVVKEIDGFDIKRGPVVERIIAGTNIKLTSSAGGGQGEVLLEVDGLDGKLEGQPDILAIDDVLVERDPSLNIFYSVFPKGKASSILGKIDIPSYLLPDKYKLELSFNLLTLHSVGTSEIPPTLSLSWVTIPDLTTAKNLATDVISSSLENWPAQAALTGRTCYRLKVDLAAAIPGSSVFFKLGRGSTDSYGSKIGLISTVYKFVSI